MQQAWVKAVSSSLLSCAALSPCNGAEQCSQADRTGRMRYCQDHRSPAAPHNRSCASEYCQLILLVSSFFPEILVNLLIALAKLE